MANPIKQYYRTSMKNLRQFAQVQDESGATDMEVNFRELARVYEKGIDDDYDINWEV